MPTRSALTFADTVAQGTLPAAAPSDGGGVRTQAALVRSLVDEVEDCHPSDRFVAPLRAQLAEELAQLGWLVTRGSVPTATTAAEPEPIDVLVVDDEHGARRTAVRALERMGYRCRTAESAEEALREYDREPSDVVLSDWCMPGANGLDLCAALKRREPPPYVILVSGFHEKAALLDGVRGGADDFVRKPMDLDELEVRLFAASRLIRAVRAVVNSGQ